MKGWKYLVLPLVTNRCWKMFVLCFQKNIKKI
jgi:hypothetical protein